MKILHLLKHGYGGNGSVNVAVDLACEQAKSGHTVYFACARPYYRSILESAGVSVFPVPEASSFRSAARALLRVVDLLQRYRPEIVHAHMMSSAVLGRIALTPFRKRLVTTVHNSFDRHSVLMRFGDRVVAVSKAERDALVRRGFAPQKMATVLNGVAGSRRESTASSSDIVLEQPAIVSLGGLHPRKGVDDIIRAFALSKASSTWHLNIVGGGPQLNDLERLAASLRVSNVHFKGSTAQSSKVLRQAKLFVTASLADPCPLVVMEARQEACAIVGTNVGGIPEILSHGVAGRIVGARDVEQLARAIDAMVSDPVELEEWRRRSGHGSEYFNVGRMATEYELVYKDLLQGGRPPTESRSN